MTFDVIEKFVESKEMVGKPVNIFFKQRNTIAGLFVQGKDYQEMKAKNFWRIVTGANIDNWKKSKDMNLARIFNGAEFTKLSLD